MARQASMRPAPNSRGRGPSVAPPLKLIFLLLICNHPIVFNSNHELKTATTRLSCGDSNPVMTKRFCTRTIHWNSVYKVVFFPTIPGLWPFGFLANWLKLTRRRWLLTLGIVLNHHSIYRSDLKTTIKTNKSCFFLLFYIDWWFFSIYIW